jgi:hypothetical protein
MYRRGGGKGWGAFGRGWALKISAILYPNGTRYACCHFRAQTSLDFQGPPLPMALVMDVARIKIITFRAI